MKLLKLLILFFILFIVLGGIVVFLFEKKATTVIDQRMVPVVTESQQTGNLTNRSNPTATPTSLPGVLSLTIPSSHLKVGQETTVGVLVQADGKSIIGSDVILRYDPALLRADKVAVDSAFFDTYPRKTIDNVKGIVSITAFQPIDATPLNGPRDVAGISFTALQPGTADISIDYVPNTTNHSTIVESSTSRNILGAVVPVTLTIGK